MAQNSQQFLAANTIIADDYLDIEYSPDKNSKLSLTNCPIENGFGFANCAKTELLDFMYKMEYPTIAYEYAIEGHCRVNFTVSGEGDIVDLQVANCSEKIFREPILKRLSKLEWRAATTNGNSVKSIAQFDIKFKM